MDLKLLQDFFKLDYEFYTTPQVIGEITHDDQISEIEQYIQAEILLIDNQGTLESIQELYNYFPGLSFADSSVLELTSRVNGILLSSDKGLRNITRKNNLIVKGVLWIIEEMVNMGILTKEIAVQKLLDYPMINTRVPNNEIKKLIGKLQYQQ